MSSVIILCQVLRQPVPCSESQNQLYGPISGSLALTGIPLFNMTLTNFTAVAVDTTDVFNVLFLGTSNGHLIKVITYLAALNSPQNMYTVKYVHRKMCNNT